MRHASVASPTDRPAQFPALSVVLLTLVGPDGYFLRLNPAFAAAVGYTEAELIGSPFLTFVHAEDRAATQGELEKLSRGQPALGFENRFMQKNGAFRWLAWTAVPTPQGVVYAAARDVTALKLTEEQSAAASVSEPTTPLAHKDEFLVSVSHDLQQPLTLIKGQVQLLQRRMARGEAVDPALLEQGLGYVNAAVLRMRAMLEELLETALEQAGQPQRLQTSPTDLVVLVQRAVDEYQLAFELHHFVFEAEAASMLAMVDAARVLRTVENLLSNAVKYSPRGGPIRVTLTTTTGVDRSVKITVQDAGLGIPSVDVPFVFDRFFRGANVVGRIAGNGLGMAGARQMVELHGGTISVQSQEGVGSTFTVLLPLHVPTAV